MKKLIGATCFVAGTMIGAGALALPLTISKIGFLWGTLVMVLIWAVMYGSALISLELNLQNKKGADLSLLGKIYSGRGSQIWGGILLFTLSYSLLAAYLYGLGSVTQILLQECCSALISQKKIMVGMGILLGVMLCFSTKRLDYGNRWAFFILLGLFLIIFIGLGQDLSFNVLSFEPTKGGDLKSWFIALPVIFTSFGFHVIFHPLVDYCDLDAKILRRSFFWGSLIALFLYLVWTLVSLGSIARDIQHYEEWCRGSQEVSAFIQQLAELSGSHWIQKVTWGISFCAILTSIIGVSISLFSSWQSHLLSYRDSPYAKPGAIILTLLVPLIIALFVPNAFIGALGFAGLVLAQIAIFQPLYLFSRAKINHPVYPLTQNPLFKGVLAAVGVLVSLAEIICLLR